MSYKQKAPLPLDHEIVEISDDDDYPTHVQSINRKRSRHPSPTESNDSVEILSLSEEELVKKKRELKRAEQNKAGGEGSSREAPAAFDNRALQEVSSGLDMLD